MCLKAFSGLHMSRSRNFETGVYTFPGITGIILCVSLGVDFFLEKAVAHSFVQILRRVRDLDSLRITDRLKG